MKILICIDSLTCGGAEKSLISLLPFLTERGYEITLMLRARGGLFEQYVPDQVNVVDFPYNPGLLGRLVYSFMLRMPWNRGKHTAELYWRNIGQYFPQLKGKYDVAIAYQQGFPTFYIAEKVNAQKKYCWVNADIESVGYSPLFCKPFYLKYNKVIAVSDTLKRGIVYPKFVADGNKLLTVWDILNEELIKNLSAEYNVYQGDDNLLKICTVGRLVPLKGYDLAIAAAKILKDKGVKFRWHIIGGGIKDELEEQTRRALVDDCMVFEGEKLNPYPYISNCDIYVQTSKYEGFGLTIGEAKILGKPIVSTNFPVVYNQITPEENGLVVEMTGEAIAEGIIRLINDKDLREKLQSNVKAERNMTAETESTKVIKLIEQ